MSTAVRTNATSRPNAPMQHHGRITPMATFLQYLGCIELVKIIRSLSRNGLIHPGDLNDIDVCDIPELIAELKKDGINIGDRNRIRRHCTAIAFNFQPSAPATGRFIAGSAPATASGPTRAVSTAPVLLPNKPTLSPLQLANAALEGAQRGTSAAASASSAKPHPAPVLNINYAKTPAHAPATPHKAAASSSSSQGTSTAPSGGPRTGKRMKPERCKACGQTDHVRRTRTKCPAHPDYNPKDYTLESKLYKSTLDAASAFAADENLLHPPPRGNWGGAPGYRCRLCHRRYVNLKCPVDPCTSSVMRLLTVPGPKEEAFPTTHTPAREFTGLDPAVSVAMPADCMCNFEIFIEMLGRKQAQKLLVWCMFALRY
eukprot:m.360267 g.360267  ORF g.360267 m.360267 type:complete len:372 (+) comp20767_c0_seq40:348-1463(+)